MVYTKVTGMVAREALKLPLLCTLIKFIGVDYKLQVMERWHRRWRSG